MVGVLAWGMQARAQDRDDARRVLEQERQQQAAERERELLKDEVDAENGRPTITIDGRVHVVEHTADDVGRALYLALQQRQWRAVAHFLAEYLTLPDRDPLLVHYAQGGLARAGGRHAEAEREYRRLLARQPGFLPARLELARTLFEDQQDLQARQLFTAIAASIDAGDARIAGVRDTIATFQKALDRRLGWSGTVSLGPTWSDNINRTSASHTCLWLHPSGICLIDRRLPDAIQGFGLDYDASSNKRMVLYGHHGLAVRAIAFGQAYRDHSAHNELNAVVQAGYSYRSARRTAVIAPSFDYYALGNDMLYGAFGMHGEWTWTATPRSMLKLEADWKDAHYRQEAYARNFDGIQRSASATYFHSLDARWLAFGGVDLTDSEAPDRTSAWRSRGIRLGASLQWPEGVSSTLFASWRRRDHAAYSPLFDARRQDDEQNYTFILRTPRWEVAGFVPVLTLRHNRVQSNIDWLYSYDRNTVSLKLERSF